MAGPTIQILFPPQNLRAAYGAAADRLSEFVGQDVTDRMAQELAKLIIQRTRGGQGIEGTFVDYKPATQIIKGVGPQPVTLTDQQKRLDLLIGRVSAAEDAIVIAFGDADAEKIFTFHQTGTKRMDARPWLGLTSEEEQFLFFAMQRIIETDTVPAMEQATGLPRV